jgi:DNA-binding beta-propeller fold protein YncE
MIRSILYEEAEEWAKLPSGWNLGEVPGIAVDSQDRVFAFCRSEHPVVILDRHGQFLGSWGEGMFSRPHMIYIGSDDSVYCVDDVGHTIKKFTPDGDLLLTITSPNGPADTGYTPGDPSSVRRSGPPFNRPTDIAVAPSGHLLISDGYGNARVHRFTADGRLLQSWGDPGCGPAQFVQPHGIYVDERGCVYVADRRNKRIQLFSAEGQFLSQWTDIWWPCGIAMDKEDNVYVAEVGGHFMFGREAALNEPAARITIRDLHGNIQAEWGEQDPKRTGRFFSPHSIAVDSQQNVYVGEVTLSYPQGQAPPGTKVMRKYVRV